MTSITPEWGSDKIAYNLTGPEVTFIEQARCRGPPHAARHH